LSAGAIFGIIVHSYFHCRTHSLGQKPPPYTNHSRLREWRDGRSAGRVIGKPSGGRMKPQVICLSMIVKDEVAVIRLYLDSVRSLIGYWVIADTGWTDRTQDIIREHLEDLPGELHERPWRDFARNRSKPVCAFSATANCRRNRLHGWPPMRVLGRRSWRNFHAWNASISVEEIHSPRP
jgi:hypothetical protein